MWSCLKRSKCTNVFFFQFLNANCILPWCSFSGILQRTKRITLEFSFLTSIRQERTSQPRNSISKTNNSNHVNPSLESPFLTNFVPISYFVNTCWSLPIQYGSFTTLPINNSLMCSLTAFNNINHICRSDLACSIPITFSQTSLLLYTVSIKNIISYSFLPFNLKM